MNGQTIFNFVVAANLLVIALNNIWLQRRINRLWHCVDLLIKLNTAGRGKNDSANND